MGLKRIKFHTKVTLEIFITNHFERIFFLCLFLLTFDPK